MNELEAYQNLQIEEKNGVPYLTMPRLEATGLVRHAFSTRQGGVSQGSYASLNLAYHVGDEPTAVAANRLRFWTALGLSLADTVTARQEHTTRVVPVGAGDRGRGAWAQADALPATDGLLTDVPGVVLAAFFADCVPVLLLDPVRKVIGVVHAGWRGTVDGIAGQAVNKMGEVYGSDPRDCLAGIGPSISPGCYPVDHRVIQPLQGRYPDWDELAVPVGKGQWDFNLPETVRRDLVASGIDAGKITMAGACTTCDQSLFFSHRGSGGKTGRLAALLTLV